MNYFTQDTVSWIVYLIYKGALKKFTAIQEIRREHFAPLRTVLIHNKAEMGSGQNAYRDAYNILGARQTR